MVKVPSPLDLTEPNSRNEGCKVAFIGYITAI